jgi:hypothetical protein
MATLEECEQALRELAAQIAAVDEQDRRRYSLDRTVSCDLTDLGDGFTGRFSVNGLEDLARGTSASANVKLRCTSDDLIALTRGELNLGSAWASGRIKIDASVFDLIKLRAVL